MPRIILNATTKPVTKNLFDALTALRHESTSRMVWIDALCINQDDIEERGAQVQMMTQIYKSASKVLIWLGVWGPEVPHSLGLINMLSYAYSATKGRNLEVVELKREMGNIGLPYSTHPAWENLVLLWGRPWFSRVWVMQEAAMAQHAVFLIGDEEIEYKHMIDASVMIDQADWSQAAVAKRNMSIMMIENYRQHEEDDVEERRVRELKSTLLIMLLAVRSRKTTDNRDRVFAVLGLASDVISPKFPGGINLKPDYTLSTGEVYLQTAQRLIQHSKNLVVLGAAGLNTYQSAEVEGLPSWVPDWSLQGAPHPLTQRSLNDRYAATPHSTCTSYFSGCGRELFIEGHIVDIVATSRPAPDAENAIAVLNSWIDLARNNKPFELANSDEFMRTLIADQGLSGDGVGMFEKLGFYEWLRIVMNANGHNISKEASRGGAVVDDMVAQVRFLRYEGLASEVISHRSFFITESGRMGVGGKETKDGDMVVLVKGAALTLVLRKANLEQGDAKEKWILIGESYVDGLVYGEGWDEEKIVEFIVV
jgi:hypothetical protein